MPFLPNIPQPGDELADSQVDLLGNNQQLDTTFGIDHYTFSNLTTNNGKHNLVTTPIVVGATHPTTAAAEPKFYAMQETANIGVIQYSRGPSDAVPTPVTKLQSPSTGIIVPFGGTTNILDFSGMGVCIATVWFASLPPSPIPVGQYSITNSIIVGWNGTAFVLPSQSSVLNLVNTGNILQIVNLNLGQTAIVYWSLEIHRIS